MGGQFDGSSIETQLCRPRESRRTRVEVYSLRPQRYPFVLRDEYILFEPRNGAWCIHEVNKHHHATGSFTTFSYTLPVSLTITLHLLCLMCSGHNPGDRDVFDRRTYTCVSEQCHSHSCRAARGNDASPPCSPRADPLQHGRSSHELALFASSLESNTIRFPSLYRRLGRPAAPARCLCAPPSHAVGAAKSNVRTAEHITPEEPVLKGCVQGAQVKEQVRTSQGKGPTGDVEAIVGDRPGAMRGTSVEAGGRGTVVQRDRWPREVLKPVPMSENATETMVCVCLLRLVQLTAVTQSAVASRELPVWQSRPRTSRMEHAVPGSISATSDGHVTLVFA